MKDNFEKTKVLIQCNNIKTGRIIYDHFRLNYPWCPELSRFYIADDHKIIVEIPSYMWDACKRTADINIFEILINNKIISIN